MLNPATAIKQLDFAWSGLGIATGTPVDYEAARLLYQKELRDARVVNDLSAMMWAQGSLAHILIRLKQFKSAHQYASECLKAATESNDYAAMGYANNLLGDSAYAQGKMEDANLFYRRGWDAYAKIGEEKGQAWSYTNIGNSAQAMGDFETADRMYTKSLELIARMNDSRALAWNKNLLGSVGWCVGRYDEAWKHYQEALELYMTNQDTRGQAWTLDLMGNLKLAMKDDEESEKLYRQARALSSALGEDPQGTAWHHYHMGAVYLFRGDLDDSKDEFEKAMRFFEDLNDSLGQAATLTHLGEIACKKDKEKQALDYLKRDVEIILSGKSNPLLVDALAGVAQLLQVQGQDKKAISLLMVALSNPTCRQQTKDRMVSIANELETEFTPGEVDKGFRWAKGADLEEMAQGWLNSLTVLPVKKVGTKKIAAKRPAKKKSAPAKTKPKAKKKKR